VIQTRLALCFGSASMKSNLFKKYNQMSKFTLDKDQYSLSIFNQLLLVVTSMLALASCGGGGENATPQNTIPSITVSGTAAVGAPLIGVVITANCSGWIGKSVATDLKGNYSLLVPSLPCELSTFSPNDGTTLHSFATKPGTANLTLFTEAIFQVSGGNPSNLSTATVSVTKYLGALGVDVGADPISISFDANGLGHDGALDSFSRIIASTPLTGAGSTSPTNEFITSLGNRNLVGQASPSTLDRLAKFADAWNQGWAKIGASDPVYGSVKGVKQFLVQYSTKYKAKYYSFPKEFDDYTEKQILNLSTFSEGWKTCGFQDASTVTKSECAIGRMSAVLVDLGYNWFGSAAKTAVNVVLVMPVEEATSASFDMYRSISTGIYDAELASGAISQADYDWIIGLNQSATEYARLLYDTVVLAKDAKDVITKVNSGYAKLKQNFAGKNAARLTTFGKLRNPFKKMLSGVKDGYLANFGSTTQSWSQEDKTLFIQLINQTSDDFLDVFFGPEVTVQPTFISLNPLTATINQPTTFTATGTNLPATAELSISGGGSCATPTVPNADPSTGFKQTCTLSGSAGTRSMMVLAQAGGASIGAAQTISVSLAPLVDLPTVSPPSSNVLLGGTFTSSCASCPSVPANALTNGNLDDGQNLQTYSGSFSISVASPVTLDRLVLYPYMTPNGTVSYEIQTSTSATGAAGTWTSYGVKSAAMANEVAFPILLGSTVTGVRVVRVIINSSPSWVAFAEIEGYIGTAPTAFYDVFRASALDLSKWRIDPADSQGTPINATYSILASTGELIVDVPGGSNGFAGVASGNRFVAKTGEITTDFEVTMSAAELLRQKSGVNKDNSGVFLSYGKTSIGILGNYSGYWPNYAYGTYNKHRVWAFNSTTGTNCVIDETFDQNTLYAMEFRIRRVGTNGYVAYRIKGSPSWSELACAMDASAEAGFYFWSADGGNTQSTGRFKGSVDNFVLKVQQVQGALSGIFTVVANTIPGATFTVPAGTTTCQFNASGSWAIGPFPPYPDLTANGYAGTTALAEATRGAPLPTAPVGALVGKRSSNSIWQLIGTTSLLAVTSGETIVFMMNDATDSGYTDGNRGSLAIAYQCQ
jgi:hypothetical protein